MEVIEGVLNAVPEPKLDPPEAEVNQFKVPALAVAYKVTTPASQREPGVVLVTVGVIFIVAIMAVLDDTHPLAEAST